MLFIGLSLLLELPILVSEVGQACSASLRQALQTLYSPLQHHLTFGEFRVADLLFPRDAQRDRLWSSPRLLEPKRSGRVYTSV